MSDFDALFRAMDKFADDVQRELPRAGAAAMALAVYETARELVPQDSGRLKASIYRVYSKDNSDKGKATYHVAWNHKKAPHGYLIEFGTSRAPAHPFLYPAYEQNRDKLEAVAVAAMKHALEKT